MLQEGDKVTLGLGPTIQFAPYQSVRPHAAVTRVMSDDILTDLENMAKDLRELLLRSLRVELGLTNEMLEAVEQGGVDGLAEFCMQEIGDVAEKSSFTVQKGKAGKKGGKKKAVKKHPK